MNTWSHIKYVYFIGIGGIGMSALARYFKHIGHQVAGYDRTETPLTRALVDEGILVCYDDDFSLVPDVFRTGPSAGDTLIVYTPAVPSDSRLLSAFRDMGYRLYKRSEVLGVLSEGHYTIAVAGTHGKTTTSCMIAHLLTDSGKGCSAFLGGISSNYNTNTLFGHDAVLVVEADEYDRSFLTLHPDLAIVTSADADHLDIYGDQKHLTESFALFLTQVKEDGKKIVREGLPFSADIWYAGSSQRVVPVEPSSTFTPVNRVYARHVRVVDGDFYFDYVSSEGKIEGIRLGIPGRHNVENAVAAITAARLLGVTDEQIRIALGSFAGVKRRFEYIVRLPETIYIDDYAHHPAELEAFLGAVRELYPTRTLTVVFQPHLYSRTRDFLDGFANALSLADTLLLMDIYPAREQPIPGIDSAALLRRTSVAEKHLLSEDGVLDFVRANRPELLVTVGAGNIDRLVEPLKKQLIHG